jgi:phosphoribosylamine---glycine ligase
VRVLLLGAGGREHALARALAADPQVTSLHAAPGNPGIAALAVVHRQSLTDLAGTVTLARSLAPDLVVVGPEAPLVAGLADALRASGISCFGPSRRAAAIEGSKSFAKQLMAQAGVPTAQAHTCESAGEVDTALAEFGPPYVVKADGLAAGKGVVVTHDLAAAREHARTSGKVVIEEFLDGPELSVFAVADGVTALPLLPAQDFKRAHDHDRGPNTGGMGAYCPLPWAPPGLAEEVMSGVIQPVMAAMRQRGTSYRGLLYAGLCLTKQGLRVVEFNARFGDPETQVVLDRLASPLAGLLAAAASGSLAGTGSLAWAPGAAVTVVVAAAGYPSAPVTGAHIEGIDEAERIPGAYVLHAGTATEAAGRLVSSGGRVLNVVGTGATLAQARDTAYQAAARIAMPGGWYRTDIAAAAAAAPSPA